MRIGIDASRAALDQRTGTERYSLELIRSLLQIDQSNEYLLYFNQPPATGLVPPGSNWRPRAIPLRRLWTHVRLSQAVRQDHLDLLFVPAHVLPIRPARRNVVTVHDLGFRRFPHAHRPLSRFYLELSTRWAALRATRLIAISQATAADLRNFYGVASNRIRVIYEGVDPSFRPVRDAGERLATLRTYGLGQRPFFLAVGTLQPRKNLGALLDAFRRFLEVTECDAELVLAGRPGWDTTALERRIAELDLGNRVKRLGFVADDDLPALYGAALAYVQPSLYEGFGLTVLEAMACGTPVVASNTSSLPEVVGESELLVDPGDPAAMADALVALAFSSELRGRLIEAGRARAESFTWTRCARETLAVLQEAAAE